MSFSNTYLILGASSDLGVALINQLNEEKSDCLFLAHFNSSKESLEKIEMKNGNSMKNFQCNLADSFSVEKFISDLSEVTEAPTHIVQLASSPFEYIKLKEFDSERFLTSMNIQVLSFVKILQKFLPIMVKRKSHNKIVSVLSSVTIGKPPKNLLEYTSIKYSLLGVMKSLAADYEGKKININSISPSMIETKFLKNVDSRFVQMVAEGSPEGRNATVNDVIPAIKFLLSDDSNYLHGINLDVSNGSIF